jgi:hypothetical protein
LHGATLSSDNELLLKRYGAQTEFYRTKNKGLFFAAPKQTPEEETIEKTHGVFKMHNGLRSYVTHQTLTKYSYIEKFY